MKKKTNKLNLAKRTISNLEVKEMSKHLGGVAGAAPGALVKGPRFTQRQFCSSF